MDAGGSRAGGAGAGLTRPGAREPHLAAFDAFVGAAAQQQAGAQQLRLHLDAHALVRVDLVAAIVVQPAGCCARPFVHPGRRRSPEVSVEPQARAAGGSSCGAAAAPGWPPTGSARGRLRAVQRGRVSRLGGAALAEEAQAGAALQGGALPIALHQVPQVRPRQAAPRVGLERQGVGLSFVQGPAQRLLGGCGGTGGRGVRFEAAGRRSPHCVVTTVRLLDG